jgi:predicted DNA-binding transcriptional regulator AlpA
VGRKLDVDDIVGVAEIADRLGVERNTIHRWRERHPDFPEPAAVLKGSLIWAWPDVAAWAKATGRHP